MAKTCNSPAVWGSDNQVHAQYCELLIWSNFTPLEHFGAAQFDLWILRHQSCKPLGAYFYYWEYWLKSPCRILRLSTHVLAVLGPKTLSIKNRILPFSKGELYSLVKENQKGEMASCSPSCHLMRNRRRWPAYYFLLYSWGLRESFQSLSPSRQQ